MQLVKERSDLEKIVEYVASHNDTVRYLAITPHHDDAVRYLAITPHHDDAVRYLAITPDQVRRKRVAYEEYLEAVRDQKVTAKNVYTTEALQRGGEKKVKKKDEEQLLKEEDERKRRELGKIRTLMDDSLTFKKLISEVRPACYLTPDSSP